MALKNQALTIQYVAWSTSTNAGQTGDALNHTIRGVGDGTEFTPTNSPAEVDSVNLPGVYKLSLLASETNYNSLTIGGKSSTSGVVIIPINITTERGTLPSVAPNTSGGIITFGTSSGQLNVTGGRADSNVLYWNGSPVIAPNVTGVPVVDIVDINGLATNGNNATLSLKQLNITNSAGDAIVASSTGSNGNGINSSGNGTGSGIKATGGGTGHGMNLIGGATSGNALNTSVTSGTTLTGTISGDVSGKILGTGSSSFTAVGCQVDVEQWKAQTIPTPAVTGVPKVDVTDWAGQVTSVDGNNYPNVNTHDYGGTTVTGGLPNSGNVTVGGYAVGQDPGTYILVTPANKLTTDSSGDVTLVSLQSPIVQNGTAQAGSSTGLTLSNGASATNNYYNGCLLKIYSGTGTGQARTITAYNGTTKVATVDYSWTTTPDATSVYAVLFADNPALSSSLTVGISGNVTVGAYAAGQDPGTYILGNPANKLTTDASGDVTVGNYAASKDPASYILSTPANKLTTDISGRIQIQYGTSTGQLSASSGVAAVNMTQCNGSSVAAGAIPNAAANASGGLLTFGSGTGQLNTSEGNVALTSTGVDNIIVESGLNLRQAMAIAVSSVAGALSGAATSSVSISAANNPATNRILATVDNNGNRSVVTLNIPS